MPHSSVADLKIDELRELLRVVVLQTLAKLVADPDKGMELRADLAAELQRSLTAVEAGGPTLPAQKAAEKLGISQPAKNNETQLSHEEFGALIDQFADQFMALVGPDCPPLSDCAVSREGLYEDHL